MKLITLSLILFLCLDPLMAQTQDTFYVASWNVENLFDNVDDPNKEDSEFLETGKKEWTNERIYDKMSHLADVMKFMNNGSGPDMIGFMEVEHKYLLEKIANNFFPERNYNIIGFESKDARGIDNYLMYDEDIFQLIDYNKIPVVFFNSSYVTRDILHGLFNYKGETVDVFVNHWPSRRGGEERSQPRRVNAASTLRRYVDSLMVEREKTNIIIMGDFNDEPGNYSINEILSAGKIGESSGLLYNLAWDDFDKGVGTHFFGKEFNMLDQIIISNTLLDNGGIDYMKDSFIIVSDPSFTYSEGKKKGAILPSFADGKFRNGYSAHLPVAAKFYYVNGKE